MAGVADSSPDVRALPRIQPGDVLDVPLDRRVALWLGAVRRLRRFGLFPTMSEVARAAVARRKASKPLWWMTQPLPRDVQIEDSVGRHARASGRRQGVPIDAERRTAPASDRDVPPWRELSQRGSRLDAVPVRPRCSERARNRRLGRLPPGARAPLSRRARALVRDRALAHAARGSPRRRPRARGRDGRQCRRQPRGSDLPTRARRGSAAHLAPDPHLSRPRRDVEHAAHADRRGGSKRGVRRLLRALRGRDGSRARAHLADARRRCLRPPAGVDPHRRARRTPRRRAALRRAPARGRVGVRTTNYLGMPHGFLSMPRRCRAAPQAIAEIAHELGSHDGLSGR